MAALLCGTPNGSAATCRRGAAPVGGSGAARPRRRRRLALAAFAAAFGVALAPLAGPGRRAPVAAPRLLRAVVVELARARLLPKLPLALRPRRSLRVLLRALLRPLLRRLLPERAALLAVRLRLGPGPRTPVLVHHHEAGLWRARPAGVSSLTLACPQVGGSKYSVT